MRTGVGLLTFDVFRTGREADFWKTYHSIKEEPWDEFVVLTNGSTDGTEDVVRELGGIVDDGDSRIFYGNTKLIEALRENDLIVLSADDLLYEEGWLERLVSFMEDAPKSIALSSAYMEPLWTWNEPRGVVNYGGERALIRDSVCGSSWCFRTKDWFDWMGPFEETMPGEDLLVCRRIAQRGKKMAALDLCEHIGQEHSAWGNESHLTARPLDKAKYGL